MGVDDYITEDNPVRFIAAFGDDLARAACGFQRAMPAAPGRPGDAPGDLWKLYLYGALHRLRSSRRLAQETHRHIALMGLWKKRRPDHQTSADCREHHRQPIRQVCRIFTRLGQKLDLVGTTLGALEGSTCSAVNANERNLPKDRLARLLTQIDARIEAYLKALDRRDEQEDQGPVGGAPTEALAAKIAALKPR